MNASSGQDVPSVVANSKCREQAWVTIPLENAFDQNNTFHEYYSTNETRGCNPDKASESPVPSAHFDRQWYTHHSSSFFTYIGSICSKKMNVWRNVLLFLDWISLAISPSPYIVTSLKNQLLKMFNFFQFQWSPELCFNSTRAWIIWILGWIRVRIN